MYLYQEKSDKITPHFGLVSLITFLEENTT